MKKDKIIQTENQYKDQKKQKEYKIIALEKGKKANTVYKQQYLKMKNRKKNKHEEKVDKGGNSE